MLRSYTVCGYCFKNMEAGSRCTCFASQDRPPTLAVRYTESLDTELNAGSPNIVGQNDETAELGVEGQFIGARIILAPEVRLCDECQKEFQEACEWIADIINKCMEFQREETLNGSKSVEEKDTSIASKIEEEGK